jgi:hypothetical protein
MRDNERMPTNNNAFPGFDRSFRRMSSAEFKAMHGPELQRAAQLKAQGKDTTALEAELARIAELQRQGKPIPKIDFDKFVRDARPATPTAGIPTANQPINAATSPLGTRLAASTVNRDGD